MTRRFFTIVLMAAIVFCAASFLFVSTGQAQSDSQGFKVTVPSQLEITAPSASETITHDETDADQAFADQRWSVKANARAGATVTFSTDQAFTHTVDSSFERDAKLDLAIFSSSGAASWALDVASDQTNYAGSDGVATVEASSTKPGKAEFDLTVTFITDTHDTLAEGDYTLTVTGTITANTP